MWRRLEARGAGEGARGGPVFIGPDRLNNGMTNNPGLINRLV